MTALLGFLWWYDGTRDLSEKVNRTRRSLSIGKIGNAGGRIVERAGLVATTNPGVPPRLWRPATTPGGRSVLFTGYITNRDALTRALFPEGRRAPDPATLYGHAVEAWGGSADLRAIGEYAAIIWHPAERTVTLVRSPLHAPPIHLWRDGEKLIAASAPRGIFASGAVPRELDEQKIADSLFLNYREGERSWFKGVSRLATGTRLTVTPERERLERYYDLANAPRVRLSSDAAYVEAATELLDTGVRTALEDFRQPAISLSGGFDSQAVAAFATRHLADGARLRGYTALPEAAWVGSPPPGRFADESAHVAALARMYPTLDVQTVDAAGLEFSHRQDAMFLLAEQPTRNAENLHWMHEIRASAARQGCDVLLTGASGNFTFSFDGRGNYLSLLRSGSWLTLVRELATVPRQRVPILQPFVQGAVFPLLPSWTRGLIRRLLPWMRRDPLGSWCPLNPDWACEMRVAERADEQAFDRAIVGFRSPRDIRVAARFGVANEAGDTQQAFWAIHGIPSRDPTGYRPLVEFCLGIPDDQYIRNGRKRLLARRMLRGVVPDMVLDEQQVGVQAADWHLRVGRVRADLLAEIEHLERDPRMRARFNLPRLRAGLEAWSERAPPPGTAEALTLKLAVPRGLTTARFIRHVEGGNIG